MNPKAHALMQNAPKQIQDASLVKINYPAHPFHNHLVKIIKIHGIYNPDLTVLLPDGTHLRLDHTWTDYAERCGLNPTDASPRLLDAVILLKVAEMIGPNEDNQATETDKRRRGGSPNSQKKINNTNNI
jgi:hypothetical protein